jgi:hypothetical protein
MIEHNFYGFVGSQAVGFSIRMADHAAHTDCANKAIGDTVRNAGIVVLSRLYTEKTASPVAAQFAYNSR